MSEKWVVGPGETRSVGTDGRPDHEDAARIEADIARTRREMSGTIDELQRRLDPERVKAQVRTQVGELAEEAKHAVREATIGRAENMVAEVKYNARSMRAGLIDTIRENPLPAALAAIGIGWLFVNGSSRADGHEHDAYYRGKPESYGNARYRYGGYAGYQAGRYRPEESERGWTAAAGETAGRVQERAADAAGRVGEQAGQVVGAVQDQAGRMAEGVQERAGEMVEQAGNVVSSAQFEAMRTRYRVEGMMRGNPLAAGAVALAAGVVVGMALPETESEQRFMGEARENLMDRARSVAEDAVEKVSQVAAVATDAAKTEMTGGKPESSASGTSLAS